jgi:hypothetical protein
MSDGGVRAAIERAQAFVAAHGDAIDQARAALAAGAGDRSALLTRIGDAKGFAPALRALALLDAIGVRRGAEVDAAVAALVAAQEADGSWRAGDEIAEDDAIATTARVAALLARTPAAPQKTLDAAAAWLAAHWSPERAQGGDPRLIGGYAGFFANFDHALADAVLQWCGRELERGFRTGALDALAVGRVLAFCDASGLPGARLDPRELVLSLLALQDADGGFALGATPEERVAATLDAMAALRRLTPRA